MNIDRELWEEKFWGAMFWTFVVMLPIALYLTVDTVVLVVTIFLMWLLGEFVSNDPIWTKWRRKTGNSKSRR